MGAPTEISGFVLAGGRSSRLGRDKATLPWPPNAFAEGNRQTLLQHSVARLQTVCSTVSVCANRDDLPFAGTVIPDALPGSGPLGGIVAALEHTTTDWNLMLAVDLPFLPVEVLQALVGRARSREATGTATSLCLPGQRWLASFRSWMDFRSRSVGCIIAPLRPGFERHWRQGSSR